MTCENCKREDHYAWFLCIGCWDHLTTWTQIQIALAYEFRDSNQPRFQAWKEHAMRTIKGKPFPVYAKL